MSTTRSRAMSRVNMSTQKHSAGDHCLLQFKQSLGIEKVTSDEELAQQYQQILRSETAIIHLKKVLSASKQQFVNFGIMWRGTIEEVMKFADLAGPASSHYRKLQTVNESVYHELPERLGSRFDQHVVNLVDEWLTKFTSVRDSHKAYEANHIKFDHYTSKVTALREKVSSKRAKGGKVSAKDLEKLERNEAKLEENETLDKDSRKDLVDSIEAAHAAHPEYMAKLVLRLMQFQLQGSRDSHTTFKEYSPYIDSLLEIVRTGQHAAVIGQSSEARASAGADTRTGPSRESAEAAAAVTAAVAVGASTAETTSPATSRTSRASSKSSPRPDIKADKRTASMPPSADLSIAAPPTQKSPANQQSGSKSAVAAAPAAAAATEYDPFGAPGSAVGDPFGVPSGAAAVDPFATNPNNQSSAAAADDSWDVFGSTPAPAPAPAPAPVADAGKGRRAPSSSRIAAPGVVSTGAGSSTQARRVSTPKLAAPAASTRTRRMREASSAEVTVSGGGQSHHDPFAEPSPGEAADPWAASGGDNVFGFGADPHVSSSGGKRMQGFGTETTMAKGKGNKTEAAGATTTTKAPAAAAAGGKQKGGLTTDFGDDFGAALSGASPTAADDYDPFGELEPGPDKPGSQQGMNPFD